MAPPFYAQKTLRSVAVYGDVNPELISFPQWTSPAYSTSPKAPTAFTTRSRPTHTPRSARPCVCRRGRGCWTWAAVRGRCCVRRHGHRHEPLVHRAGPKPCGGAGRGRSGRLRAWRCATSPTPANTWAGACSRSWRAEVGDGAEKAGAPCVRHGRRRAGGLACAAQAKKNQLRRAGL